LAHSLRTDQPLFRRLARESADIIRFRELSRLEDDLIQDYGRLINQLREQLHRYFPQLLQLSAAAEDPWLWDLIEIAPVPSAGRKLTRGRIERLLKQHRIVDEVMTALGFRRSISRRYYGRGERIHLPSIAAPSIDSEARTRRGDANRDRAR
jgi:hypothetical protein